MATFVLVHGSMHGGWCSQRVAALLRAAGHDVLTPTLTGLGERAHLAHPDIDLDTHIQDVIGVLFYEGLREVILVGHSYGAAVITGVADRAPDRITHLVYLDGVQVSDGAAALDSFPAEGQTARRELVEHEGDGWMLPPPADLTGLGNFTEDDAAWVRSRLSPQPFKTFTQPLRLTHPAGFQGPKTFIMCTETPAARWRELMLERARLDAGWNVASLATGHDAMITSPDRLTELLLGII